MSSFDNGWNSDEDFCESQPEIKQNNDRCFQNNRGYPDKSNHQNNSYQRSSYNDNQGNTSGYRKNNYNGGRDYGRNSYNDGKDYGRNSYNDGKDYGRNNYNDGRNYESSRNYSRNSRSRNYENQRNDDEPQESTEITIQSRDCGRIIGKGGSKIRELQEDSGARIKVCKTDGTNDDIPVLISGSTESIAAAKKMIEELIEEANMYRRPTTSRHDDYRQAEQKQNLTADGQIDWSKVLASADKERTEHWAKFEPIIKDFYIEHDDVADMTKMEVDRWRKTNFDLSVVDLSKKLDRISLNPVLTFDHAFCHYPEIIDEIDKQGFEKPSPIQSQVWPLALRGYDVIGIAQTGTGKTLAFLLPALIHIDKQTTPRSERKGPSALVLTPTRELALQIEAEIKKYSYRGIRCVCVYGGGDRKKQVKAVMSGVEIVVATPGRFNDLLDCQIITLECITYLVLDEADRMLDMGFEPQIMKILIDIRPDRQTLMTSATWPSGVRRLAESYLTEPFQVNVGSLDLAATHTVQQIIEVIAEEDKKPRLFDFISEMKEEDKVLIFVGKKSTCDFIAADLALHDINCQSIHGGREQYDREQALEDFKSGATRILVATDVASRGLDVKDITHVVNLDFPRNTEEYVHRVGRTGRAGRSGISLSLVTRDDWGSAKELIDILEEAQQEVPLELYDMAERFSKMKERRATERGGRRGGGGRGYRGGGRGRGRGGGMSHFGW